MIVKLTYEIKNGESPYDAGVRIAKKFNMVKEFDLMYSQSILAGNSKEESVWCALNEWDMLNVQCEDE